MEITYTKHGDYYYPDLTLLPQPTGDIGRFGRMRKKFLKEHQPDTFALMLMENTLTELKARNQLEWIRRMNSCRARAEEQVIREIVLAD